MFGVVGGGAEVEEAAEVLGRPNDREQRLVGGRELADYGGGVEGDAMAGAGFEIEN